MRALDVGSLLMNLAVLHTDTQHLVKSVWHLDAQIEHPHCWMDSSYSTFSSLHTPLNVLDILLIPSNLSVLTQCLIWVKKPNNVSKPEFRYKIRYLWEEM